MQKSCFSYPVEIVNDVFGESAVLAETLKKVSEVENPQVLIVADANVVQRTEGLGTKIGRYVQEHGIRLAGNTVVLSAGEKVKADSLQSAFRIYAAMISSHLSRNDIVLALGGGSTLDIAGYAASQVMGGVKLVRIPTTPASMTDAAFADYAAVDSASVKDALRVPSVPSAVLIDPLFANTVLEGVWRGYVGESVRQAVAKDAALLKKIVKLAPALTGREEGAIGELVEAVVASRQKRGSTSVGLWSAARLETMSNYKLPHGYGVLIGLCVDIFYAAEKGYLKEKDRDALVSLIDSCGAFEAISHSGHLLQRTDFLLEGLDVWACFTGHARVEIPSGLGKSAEEVPDREVYAHAIKTVCGLPTRA